MSEIRKLAAILVWDVVGFSRLAGADEERLLARLRALRSDLTDPTVAVHKGRVVKRTGDGAIVEFRSAVEAVRCALEIQEAMVERNAGVPEDRRLVFRVGLHVGDVVEESDGDLMGDGVNIAARLEGVCAPGAICLSEDAYRQVKSRLDLDVADLGEVRLKNIAEPVRAYSLKVGAPTAPATEKPAAAEKPSIAALPFQNMSSDAEQDYFVDGLVEDILTGMSRIKSLLVIARHSSFVYKGRAVDIRQVGRELGVRYVLEGSVRKAGSRLRITAQLIEAETGAHLWADRFDGDVSDVFAFQDQVAERVVGVIEPSVLKSEIERARRKPPGSLAAYDLYLRALPHLATASPAEARIAAPLLRDALQLDPHFARARAHLAHCHEICFVWGDFDFADRKAGLEQARAVLASSTDDATALATSGFVLWTLAQEREAAWSGIERALSYNPCCAAALLWGALFKSCNGDGDAAIELAERALRISPFDPFAFNAHFALGLAAVSAGRFDEAASRFAKALQSHPQFLALHGCYAIALALAARADEAREAAQKAVALGPRARVGLLLVAVADPVLADRLRTGAKLAGLPM
jgi:TolB-like protein